MFSATQTHLRIVAQNSCICLFPSPRCPTDQINCIALTQLTHPYKAESHLLTDVHIPQLLRWLGRLAAKSDNLGSYPTRRNGPALESCLLAAVYVPWHMCTHKYVSKLSIVKNSKIYTSVRRLRLRTANKPRLYSELWASLSYGLRPQHWDLKD